MSIDINEVIDEIIDIFDLMSSIPVQIGSLTIDLLSIEILFILVNAIIFFITAFTSPKKGDE